MKLTENQLVAAIRNGYDYTWALQLFNGDVRMQFSESGVENQLSDLLVTIDRGDPYSRRTTFKNVAAAKWLPVHDPNLGGDGRDHLPPITFIFAPDEQLIMFRRNYMAVSGASYMAYCMGRRRWIGGSDLSTVDITYVCPPVLVAKDTWMPLSIESSTDPDFTVAYERLLGTATKG